MLIYDGDNAFVMYYKYIAVASGRATIQSLGNKAIQLYKKKYKRIRFRFKNELLYNQF